LLGVLDVSTAGAELEDWTMGVELLSVGEGVLEEGTPVPGRE
jgi:hypothetical protein